MHGGRNVGWVATVLPSALPNGAGRGVRVCYVYFEEFGLVLLVIAYDHNEKDNLSPEEKEGIKQYIAKSRKWLSKRHYK